MNTNFSRTWRMSVINGLIASLIFFEALPVLGQQNATIPFLPNSFSVFNTGASTASAREFCLTVPKGPPSFSTLAQEGTPTISAVITDALNPNSDALANGLEPYVTSDGYWLDLAMAEATYFVSCGDYTAVGAGAISLNCTLGMYISLQDNLDDEMSQRVLPAYGLTYLSYSVQDVDLMFTNKGGQYDSQGEPLHGKLAIASGINTNNNSTGNQEYVGNMILILNWGVDPLGNTNYFLANIFMVATVEAAPCLSLDDSAQHFYGGTLDGYFTQAWTSLTDELQNGQMYLQGSVPDLLYVYDYSGAQTIGATPSSTVPAGLMDIDTVLGTNGPLGYTNCYPIINQYDAGYADGLPNISGEGGPGGTACGPTSLGMFLYFEGIGSVDLPTVYANTTIGNAFDENCAQAWLSGSNSYGSLKFSARPPLASGTTVSFKYAEDASSPSAPGILAVWSAVDGVLDLLIPVIVRTDLGVGQGPGSGHMILLLGRGHNDDLADFWSTAFGITASGDYYIVADPAGCYYANYSSKHYGPCLTLSGLNAGMNFGGWFAMYPKELLQKRLSDADDGIYFLAGLTIGTAFARPNTTATVHSPLNMLVTDPMGRQTGVLANGTIVNSIPNSSYERATLNLDEISTTFNYDGPKSVEIDSPMDGVYHVQLTGTNSGSYEMDWTTVDAGGNQNQGLHVSGTTSVGQQTNYTYVVALGMPPALECSSASGALSVFWPTNTPNYVLESSTNIVGASWAAIAGPFIETNGLYTYGTPVVGSQQFFRLKGN